jgi:hypothetical protein
MESEDIVKMILKRLENKSNEALESFFAKRLTKQSNETLIKKIKDGEK